MLDSQDLKKFAKLPPAFNQHICRDIERAIDEYDKYRAYIAKLIDRKGEMAFQDAQTYFDIADDIRFENYPNEEKLIQVVNDIYKDNCGGRSDLNER